jgi:hypothetical protein
MPGVANSELATYREADPTLLDFLRGPGMVDDWRVRLLPKCGQPFEAPPLVEVPPAGMRPSTRCGRPVRAVRVLEERTPCYFRQNSDQSFS